MIHGGWDFVTPAYVSTLGALAVLVVVVVIRARRWAKGAKELDSK